jgi:hypothetical protein
VASAAPATRAGTTSAASLTGGKEAATFTTLFARERHLAASEVAGMRPGSLQVATDHSTGDVWAYARFLPSGAAGAVAFQDGANVGVFERSAHGAWTTTSAQVANGCSAGVPAGVAKAWGLDRPALCGAPALQRTAVPAATRPAEPSAVTAATIASIANSQVGVSDNPPTNSFNPESADCDPYTAIDGVGAPECSADSTVTNANGTTTTVQNQGEYWCSDFAKWVWSQSGESDVSVLGPGADSFYAWGKDQGDTLTVDGTNPAVGDAVVLYPSDSTPAVGVSADHVGIITDVYANGNVTTVNGDFQGASVIGVYSWSDMSLASYASTAEGAGEKWVLVPPVVTASQVPVDAVADPGGDGYWELSSTGAVYSYGSSRYYGGANGQSYFAGQTAVAMAPANGGTGYWILSDTGAIYSYGSAVYHGGANGQTVVGLTANPAGTGYWIMLKNGGVYSEGVPYEGSAYDQSYFAGQTAVGIAASAGGTGYWILSNTGAIYSYGTAGYHGGANGQVVSGITADPAGTGYWIILTNGGVYSENAPYEGSAYDQSYFAGETAVSLADAPSGTGYWIMSDTGAIYSYNAPYEGGGI